MGPKELGVTWQLNNNNTAGNEQGTNSEGHSTVVLNPTSLLHITLSSRKIISSPLKLEIENSDIYD